MEEERIKSALEIAMERISAMPELTEEDVKTHKEKQYAPIGEAMAARYLGGLLKDIELPVELEKYGVEQREIVRRALVSSLCRALSFEADPDSGLKALKALAEIAPEKRLFIDGIAGDFRNLLDDFAREKQERFAETEAKALRPLGIAGTAVRCNPAENAHWLSAMDHIRQSFQPRLEALKVALHRELDAGS